MQTTQQRTPEWYAARKGKITASTVGAILGLSPHRTADDVLRAMVREYHGAPSEFTGNIATEYGQLHEPLALMDYAGISGNFPYECGFFVADELPWLGASPDGLIDDDGIVEIKCPFGLRAHTKPEFKSIHDQPHYYAQVQIQLYCTKRSWCDFFQWTKHGRRFETVEFNHKWFEENIFKLESFYKKYLSEINNPEHLEQETIEINTREALDILGEYDSLCMYIGNAESRKKELLERLVEISESRNAIMHGRKLTNVERKGNIQYAKIPELKNIDLEPYRSKPTTYWKLS